MSTPGAKSGVAERPTENNSTGITACLLLHGIVAGPGQFDSLTEELDRCGLAWRAPLLPGHGTRYQDLRGVTWRDWRDVAQADYDELARKHENIAVVGFSIGSLLGVEVAGRREVSRLVLMNSPLFSFFRILPQRLLLKIMNFLTDDIRTFAPPSSNGRPRIYRRMPVSTIYTMAELIDRCKSGLSRVNCPSLIVHSLFDVASRARSAKYLLRHLGSPEKCIYWLRSAEHSILEGCIRHRVVDTVRGFLLDGMDFIRRRSESHRRRRDIIH